MTDFVVSAKLIADASSLVSETGRGATAIDNLGERANKAGSAASNFTARTAEQSAQLRTNAAAISQVVRATNPAISTQTQLEAALSRVRMQYIQGKVGAETYARAEAIAARGAIELAQATRTAGTISGQSRAGFQQLSYQLGDVAQGFALGVNPMMIFSQQFGQVIQAVQLTTAEAGGFLGFLGGPWGIAISAAVMVLGTLAGALMSETEASGQALTAADALSQAQSALGQMFDLATGKIQHNTEALRLNAMMAAINMRAQAQQQRIAGIHTLASAGDVSTGYEFRHFFANMSPGRIIHGDQEAQQQGATVQALIQGLADHRFTPEQVVQALGRLPTDRLSHSGAQVGQAIADIYNAPAVERLTADMLQSINSGHLNPEFARTHGGGGHKGRGHHATDQTEFGQDTADRVTDITNRFVDTPPQVEAVRKAMSDLDGIMTDIQRRHPPNFAALLAQVTAARPIIEAGINKPFNDFIDTQQRSLRLLGLQAHGHDLEAQALEQILRLEEQQGPLDNAKRLAILANVEAIQREQRAIEVLHQRQQLYLDVLSETRKEITGAVTDVLGGNFHSLLDVPHQFLQSFNRLTAERFVEQTFGPAFRQLEDEVTGRNQVREANVMLAQSTDTASQAVRDFAAAATGAAATINAAQAGAAAAPVGAGGAADNPVVAVVSGDRDNPLLTNPRQFFENMVEGLLEGILGERLAQMLASAIGAGLEGIQIYNAVLKPIQQGLEHLLGLRTNPLSKLGLAGTAVGSLFFSPPRGSATITGVNDAASIHGSSAATRSRAGDLAGSVQAGLQQIAEQLGGGLGAFAVSIGIRDGKYRVDPTGKGVTKTKKGALDFGDDEAAAVMAAIMDAIRDGAITGLSAAVQKALQSSPDIDKALREAMGVDQVETLLKGVTGDIEKQLKEFERQAAERVRIARQYGFDVAKIDEINAKERLKLEQDILKSAVGSLQDLLNDMKFGDLFEGSINDQRVALQAEIAKAQADAEAGVEGAADQLADLERRMLDLLRTGFGTAGPEYAGGRQDAIDASQRVIDLENQRIADAKAAIAETNSQLNEANDQLSEQTSVLRSMDDTLEVIAGNLASLGGTTRSVTTDRLTSLTI